MSFRADISNAPSLHAFRTEAQKDEAVALKKDGLQAQPAKQSFFSRVMQWVRGENPSRINSDTKEAFVAALSREYGNKAANTALAQAGFHGGNDQPLSSREINLAVGYAKRQAEGGGLAPRSGSGTAGAAQLVVKMTADMLKTRADGVKIFQDVKKLSALVVRFQIDKNPRLGVAQRKLAEAKQSLEKNRSKLQGQAAQIASGARLISTAGTSVQPSGNRSNAELNNAQSVVTRKENRQIVRPDNEKNRQVVREQVTLARKEPRVEGRQPLDRAEQRAQARFDRLDGIFQDTEKVLASSETLLRQTSHMVEEEYAALEAELDELMANADEFMANADAISDALARPFGRG